MTNKMKQLNLGCGLDIKNGWINLDQAALPGVDVVHNLSLLPLPFKDNSFDYILCQDILEHLDNYPAIIGEIYRIMEKGAKCCIRVPHFSSNNNYADITHKKMFSLTTFDFFLKDHDRNYYFSFGFAKKIKCKIVLAKKFFVFSKMLSFYIPWIEKWINSSPKHQYKYENTCFVNLFPAINIIYEFEK